MAKMKYWNGTTWEILDAKDADTLDGKHAVITLTTTEKNDLAGAINEVKSSVDSHKADMVTDIDGAHGLKVEKGIFTPTITGTTGTGNHTYDIQLGHYYLIGRLCKFDLRLALTSKDAAMSGAVEIAGLPFISKNDGNRRVACNIGVFSGLDLDTTRNFLTAMITNGNNKINLFNNGDNTTASNTNTSQITATTNIVISGEYEIE